MLEKLLIPFKNRLNRMGFRAALLEMKRSEDLLSVMRAHHFGRPAMGAVPEHDRILVIAPHPDDELIGPGGTLIKMLEKKCSVTVLYVTDGERGAQATIRRREAQEVARIIGYQAVFMGLTANQITIDPPNLLALRKAISEASPNLLLVPFVLDDNADHRRVSELWMKAFRDLPFKTPIWAYQVYTSLAGDLLIDISPVSKRKSKAISLYKSQFQKRDWPNFALGPNAYNCRLSSGGPDIKYIEAHYSFKAEEYLELCKAYFGSNSKECYPSHPHYTGMV